MSRSGSVVMASTNEDGLGLFFVFAVWRRMPRSARAVSNEVRRNCSVGEPPWTVIGPPFPPPPFSFVAHRFRVSTSRVVPYFSESWPYLSHDYVDVSIKKMNTLSK